MRFTILFLAFILAAVTAVFADNSTTLVNNAPWWVNAILAFIGAGALGGGGVWAWLGNIIGQKNKSIQFLRNFINDLCVLLVMLRENIINNPKIVEQWNHTFSEGAEGMKQIKFLEDKAPFILKLLINNIPASSPNIAVGGMVSVPIVEALVVEKKDLMESGNVLAGLLIFALLAGSLLFAVPQAQAKETFNQPFKYLADDRPDSNMSPADGIWFIRNVYTQSFIKIHKGVDGDLEATVLSGTGVGIAWERAISINGKYHTSFSFSVDGLFSPVMDGETLKAIKFSGSIILGTQLPLIGVIGAGPGFDGKSVTANISYSGKIF